MLWANRPANFVSLCIASLCLAFATFYSIVVFVATLAQHQPRLPGQPRIPGLRSTMAKTGGAEGWAAYTCDEPVDLPPHFRLDALKYFEHVFPNHGLMPPPAYLHERQLSTDIPPQC